MTDPIKKPDRQPEGYQPKEMPEIVRMALEAKRSAVMINENLAQESFSYIKLGKVRFIGIDVWHGQEMRSSRGGGPTLEGIDLSGSWNDLWAQSGKFMPALDTLAKEYGTNIVDYCSMMHHNGKDVDVENHFLAGRFFKADTPVPEGYDFYDVPTDHAAYAVYTTDKYDDPLGAAYFATRDKVLADGVSIPYPKAYWHAELYTDGRPHEGDYRFAYLFSVEGVTEEPK